MSSPTRNSWIRAWVREGRGGMGWGGEGKEGRGGEGWEKGRGEVLLHGCWGGWTPLDTTLVYEVIYLIRCVPAG
jgi:hypothetical protein